MKMGNFFVHRLCYTKWFRAVLIATIFALLTFASLEPAFVRANQEQCENLDFSADETPRRISAERIVTAARNGCDIKAANAVVMGKADFEGIVFRAPVNFDGVFFEDDVIFTNVTFLDVASFGLERSFEPLTIKDPVFFKGVADFEEVTFKNDVNFRDAFFAKEAKFIGASIEGEADFSATYEGTANFIRTVFMDEAKFSLADFRKEVLFMDSLFEGNAVFVGTDFEGEAIFSDAVFEGDALFNVSTFKTISEFRITVFKGKAVFGEAVFNGDVNFWAIFESKTIFSNTVFTGEAQFVNSRFNGDVEFRQAVFEEDADFTNTIFNRMTTFENALFVQRLILEPGIKGPLVPPTNATTIVTNLSWEDTKNTFPVDTDIVDMHGLWEDFFIKSGKFAEARRVRTDQRRLELCNWIWSVVFAFGTAWLLFTSVYFNRFSNVRRNSRLRHWSKVLLFSLDVISPSIRPWKYDWERDGGFSVRLVAIATTIESAIGWLLLAVFSAVLVAWLVA